jgi:hypothetical protein
MAFPLLLSLWGSHMKCIVPKYIYVNHLLQYRDMYKLKENM